MESWWSFWLSNSWVLIVCCGYFFCCANIPYCIQHKNRAWYYNLVLSIFYCKCINRYCADREIRWIWKSYTISIIIMIFGIMYEFPYWRMIIKLGF